MRAMTVQEWQEHERSWWKPEWGVPDGRLIEWIRTHEDWFYRDDHGYPTLGDLVAQHASQDHHHHGAEGDCPGRHHDPSPITECSVCMKGLYDMLLAYVLSHESGEASHREEFA